MTEERYCRVWTKEGSHDLTLTEWLDFDDKKLYREDGPALEWSGGSKAWWQNGKHHRVDGPAIEWSNRTKEWFLNGRILDAEEVEQWLEENNIDLKTEEGQMAFVLRWT